MHRPPLPFKVLGQVGPLLAWAEGDDGSRLPAAWATESVHFKERERSWLLRELPTYSYDNVQEIVRGTRSHHRETKQERLPILNEKRQPRLSPPAGYDLLQAFRDLNHYFFIWNGNEPCVRQGRMEELHELAIRLPSGHIVRHAHARGVAEGVIRFEEAVELPELVTLLPSNSFGLRSVVRQGLSESHLHMKGVISAEETWADNMLRPLSARAMQGRTAPERRLLVLNLFAGRLLAIAVWMSLLPEEERPGEHMRDPQHLLRLLDHIYFARSAHEEYWATITLWRAIRKMAYDSENRSREEPEEEIEKEPQKRTVDRFAVMVPEQYRFLLRWMAPTAFHLQALNIKTRNGGGPLPGNSPEGPRERYRLVHQLHLAAHLRLIQLTPGEPIERNKREERTASKRRAWEEERGDWREKRDGWRKRQRHFLHEALFRYLVCRTHHWQLATQQGRTTGLRYFKEYFGANQRRPTGLTDLQYAQSVFDRLRQWRGLRVLEGRVAPPRHARDLKPWILAYARPNDRRIRKFGLVVHFKKEDESKEDTGFRRCPPPVPRLRWGKRRRLIRAEAIRLYQLLRRPTPVTPFVVGIDACNLELATPPEVFAPVFRFLREFPIPLSGGGARFSPYLDLEPTIRRLVENRRLGMTYHVGEDFRHLLSGLRAICEVVDFLAPQPGDRLGHGTALALHPKDWLEHNGYQAVLPRLEWLDTLVWVHHFLGPGDDLVGELALEDQIQRLSWDIYGRAMASDYDPLGLDPAREQPDVEELSQLLRDSPDRFVSALEAGRRRLLDWNWSPLTLWDAWRLRQLDPYTVDLKKLLGGKLEAKPLTGFSAEERRWHLLQKRLTESLEPDVGSRNAYLLLALYWLSPKVRKEGEKIHVVDMQEKKSLWLELCSRVEERMKRRIYEQEMVVEVNPSSNRIIGPMDRYGQHHVFHLTLDEDQRLRRQVRVSVNTDNPAVCNTTLAHEYYLLGEILIGKGVPEAEVVKWLEWLRSNGEDYNFARRLKTPEESPDVERLMKRLRETTPTVREARSRKAKYDALWQWFRETRLRSSRSRAPGEGP